MTAIADPVLATPVQRPLWLTLAAPTLILLTLVAQFLIAQGYSLLLPESFLILSAAAAAGITAGALARLRPGTLEPLLISFLLIAFGVSRPELIDLLSAGARIILAATGEPSAAISIFLAAAGGVFTLCWLLRHHLSTIVSTAFGAMLIGAILLPQSSNVWPTRTGSLPHAANDLPPVIHIILDEHIGLAGLPSGVQKSLQTANVLQSTYSDFMLYSHVYSRYARTELSLTALMTGEAEPHLSDALTRPEDSHRYRLQDNAWFRQLKEKGYAISVYQSAFLDLCSDADACYTYSGSLATLERTSYTTVQRVKVILASIGESMSHKFYPIAAMEALAHFIDDLERRPRGTAYVVHLIIPHFDYVLHDNCSVAEPEDWDRSRKRSPRHRVGQDERNARYEAYLSQLVCITHRMGDLFKTLKRLGAYDEATIIVHGDHGSRIAARPFDRIDADSLSERDLIDHFSTFMAVKTPDRDPGLSTEAGSIQDLFSRQFLRLEPGTIGDNRVYVRQSDKKLYPRQFRWPAQVRTAEDGKERRNVKQLAP